MSVQWRFRGWRASLYVLLAAWSLVPAFAWADDAPTGQATTAAPEPAMEKGDWVRTDLEELGLSASRRRYSTEDTMTFWFHTRGDQVLTEARLSLAFNANAAKWEGLTGVEVLINDETAARMTTAEVLAQPSRRIDVDSRLLSVTNALTLRILQPDAVVCRGQVAAGTWTLVQSGALETRSTEMPLRDDLSVLPLPFVDPAYDRQISIPVVFLGAPTPEMVQAAGIVASRFGVIGGSRQRFPVHQDEFPGSHALVFAAGNRIEALPDLPAASAPTIRIADNPRRPGSNNKLLVFQGPTPADVLRAAKAFALADNAFEGSEAVVAEPTLEPKREPYTAPRWLPPDPTVTFDRIAGGRPLAHKGLKGGTMELAFRIAPDLFAWPDDRIRMDIDYTQIAPDDSILPTVIVELNGEYIGRLPRARIENGISMQSVPLEVYRSQLRGFNRLQFHISWPDLAETCAVEPRFAEGFETTIALSSAIHFEDIPHFARLPDVAAFVDDGYPFTRLADLSETAIVLPDTPSPEEIGVVLSLMAHFGAITGVPGTNALVLAGSGLSLSLARDRDLLMVGSASRLPLGPRWADRLPVQELRGRLTVRPPSWLGQALALMGGHLTWREAEQVRAILARTPGAAVVAGFESPFARGRSALALTVGEGGTLPSVPDLLGFTIAHEAGGDLMVLGGETRWRFRIGPRYDVGQLAPLTRLRWMVANHWLILLPSILVMAFLLALVWRDSLSRREARRLALAEPQEEAL